MTNETKTQDIAATTLKAFKKRVNTLFTEREEWQTTLFATANQRLYELLADIYNVYLDAKDGSGVDTKKYEWLQNEVTKRKIPTSKNANFIQLITKYVFSDSDTDSRRVNSYARVLSCAAQEGVGNGNAIAEYITERGGIEEIRAALAKNTKTPKQRAVEGRSIAANAKNIAVVCNEKLAQHAAKSKGNYVVLLGIMNAQGEVEIKHAVFENDVSDERIAGKTVVSGALSNLYSTSEKARKKNEKRDAEENEANAKNKIFNKTSTTEQDDNIQHAA